VTYLLDQGANIDHQDISGLTALMRAAWNGQAETVQLLINRGAKVYLQDKYGNTALNYAIAEGEIIIARIIAGRREIDDLLAFRENSENRIDRVPRTNCGEIPKPMIEKRP
jgi:ankyrin repeat protein